jgi:hypothetical protein
MSYKTVYGLHATGDSLNGWTFRVFSKRLFPTRSRAGGYIPTFIDKCCDPKAVECADAKTIKIEIVELELED